MKKTPKEIIRILKHQLKAPLTLINGYLSFWETDAYLKFSPEKQKEFIKKALEGSKKMNQLVNDIFLMLLLDKGKPELTKETINVQHLIETIHQDSIIKSYGNKPIRFELESSSPSISITTDATHFRFILEKILDNAFRYTDKGVVRVALKQDKKYIIIQVIDTGSGFSAKDRTSAFTQLFHNSLSLYLVKQLTTLLKGKVGLSSKGEQQGTAITLQLPITL